MKIIWLIAIIIFVMICFFITMDRLFYLKFMKRAKQISVEAGKQDSNLITEDDLKDLPLPVARYMRYSGLVGRKKISSTRIVHSGSFRPGANRSFMPINGEYFLTTKKPSFCWYGKVSMIPGLTISAFDSYYNGHGKMLVKILSFFKVADVSSKEIGFSAFGRCVAEMTLVPSFFLDNQRVKWTSCDSTKAECIVTDSGLSTNAQLYFGADGSLDKIVVDRYYDRNDGQVTLEKFTGKGQDIKDYDGLKLASIIDGYWNLKEGDLHYVHFIIDRVEFE